MTKFTAKDRMVIDQHYGWLRGYLEVMNENNWRDIKDRIDNQLRELMQCVDGECADQEKAK